MRRKGITNYELKWTAKQYGLPMNLEDILMSNELADVTLKKNKNIILNLENEDNKGTHWIALCIRGKKCLYIDSYGAVCDIEVIKFCLKNGLRLGFNQYIVQDLASENCGLYALAGLLYIHRYCKNGLDLYKCGNEFINMFIPHTKGNDRILLQFLKDELLGCK